MQTISKYAKIGAALAVMLLASGAAFAYDATALEKVELAQLTPQLRSQIEARITGGQTVRGILETMLLNNISQLFATNRVVAVDSEVGTVVAQQVVAYTTDAGVPGVAFALGSPASATDWTFTGGAQFPDSTALIAIANIGGGTGSCEQPAKLNPTPRTSVPAFSALI